MRFARASVNVQIGQFDRAVELADEMLERALAGDEEKASLGFSAIRIYVLAAEGVAGDESLAADDKARRSAPIMKKALRLLKSMAAEGALDSPQIYEYLTGSPEMKLLREQPEFDQIIDGASDNHP